MLVVAYAFHFGGNAMDIAVLNTALLLGLLLGIKHATEADHVVAVSTIVSEDRNPWRGLWVGASWGLGHTTPLLLVGIAILLLNRPFPEDYSPVLEFGVGVMLVALGLQVFWGLRRSRIHLHLHEHDGGEHTHFHSHVAPAQTKDHHPHIRISKPSFRLKSYVVGMVHGLAGSAAVTLLVLSTIDGFWKGVSYLLAFGVGTVIGMGSLTLLMGVPFAFSRRSERAEHVVRGAAGAASIAFGVLLMTQIGLAGSLFA